MKFWRRVRYYLIGVGIGTLMVFIIFRGKGCSWLPENRVLTEIAESEILMSERVKCELACNKISDVNVYELFSDNNGSVLFSESEPREDPRMYVVESEDPSYRLELTIKDSVVTIYKLSKSKKKSCDCGDKPSDSYVVFKKPAGKILKDLFSQDLVYNELAECRMGCYELNEEDVITFIQKPKYIEKASKPDLKPNPIFVFENRIKGRQFRMFFEQGRGRTRLIDIIAPDESCMCDESELLE